MLPDVKPLSSGRTLPPQIVRCGQICECWLCKSDLLHTRDNYPSSFGVECIIGHVALRDWLNYPSGFISSMFPVTQRQESMHSALDSCIYSNGDTQGRAACLLSEITNRMWRSSVPPWNSGWCFRVNLSSRRTPEALRDVSSIFKNKRNSKWRWK